MTATPVRWRHNRRFRWMVRILVVALLFWFVFIVGFDGLFYYPDRKTYNKPNDFSLRFEDVAFETSDGLTLTGWFLPAVGEARGTVIHFHGNAANITGHISLVSWLPGAGYNVLMFDYRGYGRSEGKVTRAGTIIDGRAAVDYALSRPDVDPKRLFAFGQSLGGAVAIVIAAERPTIRAVVVESTFGGYRRIAAVHAQDILFSRWLARGFAGLTVSGGYDPVDVVAKIAPRPLFVIAAQNDSICPPELSRELYEAASEPKSFQEVAGAAHLDASVYGGGDLEQRIIACFEQGAALAR